MRKSKNKMFYGIGIDVINISFFQNKKTNFAKRILTKKEYLNYLETEAFLKARFLAVHWVLKEATFKATSQFHKTFFCKIEFVKNQQDSYSCSTFEEVKVAVSYNENKVYAVAIYLKND